MKTKTPWFHLLFAALMLSAASSFAQGKSGKGNSDGGGPPNAESVVLSSGTYYLEQLTMKQSDEIVIDATPEDPVVLYIEGKIDLRNSATIRADSPACLTIYSRYEGTHIFHNSSGLTGFIYMPRSHVTFMNFGNFYGGIWARSIELKNKADFYIDVSLKDRVSPKHWVLDGWREVDP